MVRKGMAQAVPFSRYGSKNKNDNLGEKGRKQEVFTWVKKWKKENR